MAQPSRSSKLDLIRNNFLLFCRNMQPEWTFVSHHKFVCDSLAQTISEHDGRMLLSVPPGYGKSSIASQMLPAYLLGINPKAKILLVTYGAALSNSHGVQARRYMSTPQYQQIFDTRIAGAGEGGSFETTEGGTLRCVGRGGAITGFRATHLILDDTIKNNVEAQSDTVINNLQDWFSTTAYSRLLPGGSAIAFNTRWTQRDIIGFILDNYKTPTGNPWPYYNLEAICDKEICPLGRARGEALWPDFQSEAALREIKAATPKTFGALYQGNPTDEAATPIKKSSILLAMGDYPKDSQSKIIASWDTASTSGGGDYTVCSVWACTKDRATLLTLIREQVDFNGLIKLFDKIQELYSPAANIIENASSGRQLIQINSENPTIISSNTIKDKEPLAESLNASLITGSIRISSKAISEAAITEIAEFPYGKHDDVVLSILHFYKNYLEQKPALLAMKGSKSKSYRNIFQRNKKLFSRQADISSKDFFV